MATSHGEYRGYLRSTIDMEAGQNRFQSVPTSEFTYRSILFGTLVIMGLLQVASSIAILLHLTGYLQEVRLTLLLSFSTSRARMRKVLFIKVFLCVPPLPLPKHGIQVDCVCLLSTRQSFVRMSGEPERQSRPSRCGSSVGSDQEWVAGAGGCCCCAPSF